MKLNGSKWNTLIPWRLNGDIEEIFISAFMKIEDRAMVFRLALMKHNMNMLHFHYDAVFIFERSNLFRIYVVRKSYSDFDPRSVLLQFSCSRFPFESFCRSALPPISERTEGKYRTFSISLIFILHMKYLFIRFHISWRIKI